MAERKLNRRQVWRSEKIQEERQRRAQKKNRDLDKQLIGSELSSEQRGLVICRYSKEFEVEALEPPHTGQLFRCLSRKNLGSIVAGDQVVWRAAVNQTGIIESRLDRSSILERPDNFGRLKAVAANIDHMVVVIAAEPAPQPNLIDRYLVAAELMQIKASLILNKADLICDQTKTKFDALLALYKSLGYETQSVISSRHQTPRLAELPDLIASHTSIVVGQSGVGKSSLINALLPDAKLQVGELSQQTREGTHTTTQARLFHLPGGGHLIDSPGIRDFSLWHIDVEQLAFGFIEIAELIGTCKFRNCQHENEPGCAILAAVKSGDIGEQRFNSFLATREAIRNQQDIFRPFGV